MLRLCCSAILAAALAALPMSTPSPAQPAPATETAKAPAKSAKTTRAPSKAQSAMRDRQKKCGEEWRAAKAAGKVEKGITWPKYWSQCNTRLKGEGA